MEQYTQELSRLRMGRYKWRWIGFWKDSSRSEVAGLGCTDMKDNKRRTDPWDNICKIEPTTSTAQGSRASQRTTFT